MTGSTVPQGFDSGQWAMDMMLGIPLPKSNFQNQKSHLITSQN